MTHRSRTLHRSLAVLAALALHLVVLALLGGAAHAKGELLRDAELRTGPPLAHDAPSQSRPQLIDLTPPEVRSLGSAGGEHAFDIPEPVRIVFALVASVVDDPEPAHPGCGAPVDLDRGRAPPHTGSFFAA